MNHRGDLTGRIGRSLVVVAATTLLSGDLIVRGGTVFVATLGGDAATVAAGSFVASWAAGQGHLTVFAAST